MEKTETLPKKNTKTMAITIITILIILILKLVILFMQSLNVVEHLKFLKQVLDIKYTIYLINMV